MFRSPNKRKINVCPVHLPCNFSCWCLITARLGSCLTMCGRVRQIFNASSVISLIKNTKNYESILEKVFDASQKSLKDTFGSAKRKPVESIQLLSQHIKCNITIVGENYIMKTKDEPMLSNVTPTKIGQNCTNLDGKTKLSWTFFRRRGNFRVVAFIIVKLCIN